MDLKDIKELAVHYRARLIKSRINPSVIVLFGSYATNCARPDSDIDLAVVAKNLGRDRVKETIKLNTIAHEVDIRLEVVPVGYFDYMKSETTSPILDQIFKTGIVLL